MLPLQAFLSKVELTNSLNHSFFHQMILVALYAKLVQYSYSELTIKLLKIMRFGTLKFLLCYYQEALHHNIPSTHIYPIRIRVACHLGHAFVPHSFLYE